AEGALHLGTEQDKVFAELTPEEKESINLTFVQRISYFKTMFMENLSSADLIYDEAGPSYDLDILSKNKVVNESLTTKLARYKEQVEIYEKGQEDTLEIDEITRKKMLKKMKSPLWIEGKIKIAP
nr:hypothetical protein [Tanacetum cinerariifolium]